MDISTVTGPIRIHRFEADATGIDAEKKEDEGWDRVEGVNGMPKEKNGYKI